MKINLGKLFFLTKFGQETIRQTKSVIDKSVNKNENISGISRSDKPKYRLGEYKNSDRFTLFCVNEVMLQI